MMAAWLQRHVQRRAARGVARLCEGGHFSVGLSVPLVPALADNLSVAYDHRADQRVRLDMAAPLFGQFQRSTHPDFSVGIHTH